MKHSSESPANTPASPTPFRLITLGRTALITPAGEDADLGRRRRKLALLAVLALATEPLTRDELAQMFWGDEEPERARHSLSDALSHLRRVLGRDVITGRSSLVELRADAILSVDAIDLNTAFANGAFSDVQALYGGAFLDNVTVEGSPAFEAWVTEARTHYASLAARALIPPAPIVVASTEHLKSGRRRRNVYLTLAVTATAAIAALAGTIAFRPTTSRGARVPLVAITDVWTDPADTSLSWLSDGLKQMIAANIGHVSSAEIVAPAVVRELSPGVKRTDSLLATESIARARRLGAGWAASALVTRQNADYVLAVTVRDAIHSSTDRRYEIRGHDIVALADKASAKLLALLDVNPSGPHLSDIETSNTAAYRHFIEGERYHAEGNLVAEKQELDAAIAADSGFTSAIAARLPSTDVPTYNRLKILFDRARARMSDWDWISEATDQAFLNGEPQQAEQLARQRLARYPRDPRGMRMLADMYVLHGSYARAESTYLKLVALDSAAEDNSVPCWTCEAYAGLVTSRQLQGDEAGVLAAARRWTELRPSYPAAWLTYADALSLNGDFRAAETAATRYRELDGRKDTFDAFTGRIMLTERRLDDAESYARRFLLSDKSGDARDLLECVLRERGQFRMALKQFELDKNESGTGSTLVYAHTLASIGETEKARRAFEASGWHPTHAVDALHNYGIFARGFSWTHALEADALKDRADTLLLRALADSIERIGSASYYARDWTTFDHVRGLIDERAGRHADAKAHFAAALSLVPGWTRTNIELAKVDMILGQPDSAVVVLRQALRQSSDAMGRYAPRSEIDYHLSLAFAKAGQLDSARVYAAYVRSAWVRADPEFKKRLVALP
ncbi:MAG: hypothetical protein ABJC26_06455 [Gemmatimonadaceae bacterium]